MNAPAAAPIASHSDRIRGLETGWIAGGAAAGPLVVFLHGYPDTADVWSSQLDHFQSRFGVVAPHTRGAGPSEPGHVVARYRPDSVALDVMAILDRVDPSQSRPLFFVGHDLGVVHAWHLAGLLHKRVAGLVAINGLTISQMAGRLRSPRQLMRSWYMFMFQLPRIPELLLGTSGGKRLMQRALAAGGLKPSERPDPKASTAPLNQYRAFVRDLPAAVMKRSRRLDCPVLVLWGEKDPFVLPPTRDELARDARDLTIRIIAGHHWLQREQSDRVNNVLGEFFAASAARFSQHGESNA
jgi:pimeloyl-ACP methyl ester carboxylesterase